MTAAATAAGITWHDGLETWIVTDRDLAVAALRDPALSSATFARSFELYLPPDVHAERAALCEFLRLWFVQEDGPEHRTLRRGVACRLDRDPERPLRPRIEAIVASALDDLAAAPVPDAVPVVAEAVSAAVMAQVLGIPGDARRLHRWARDLSAFLGALYRRDHAARAHEAFLGMAAALEECDAAAWLPRDTPEDRARATATLAMLLFGGLQTTSSLLASLVAALSAGDGLAARIARDPEAPARLVERVLAENPPLRHLGRVVSTPTTLPDGTHLAAGDLMLISLTGGIGDDPEPSAPETGPNRHLAFGHGPHYCLGAAIARTEGTILAERFARRFPRARVRPDGAVQSTNPAYLGLERLLLSLG